MKRVLPASFKAWSTKIRMGRSNKLPVGVASLKEKVGLDEIGMDASSFTNVDPSSILYSMMTFEEGVIGDLLSSSNEDDETKQVNVMRTP